MAEPVCVVSGVGPGTGTALVRRFAAGGYRIAMLARTAERLAVLAAHVPSAKAYVCDVSDQAQVDTALDLVEREMGAPSVLIHLP
jgi:NAD(P)-dependent dehydrogenase (short-subunit alcohol dehydrogenase family)